MIFFFSKVSVNFTKQQHCFPRYSLHCFLSIVFQQSVNSMYGKNVRFCKKKVRYRTETFQFRLWLPTQTVDTGRNLQFQMFGNWLSFSRNGATISDWYFWTDIRIISLYHRWWGINMIARCCHSASYTSIALRLWTTNLQGWILCSLLGQFQLNGRVDKTSIHPKDS